jgi:hypothetical protein
MRAPRKLNPRRGTIPKLPVRQNPPNRLNEGVSSIWIFAEKTFAFIRFTIKDAGGSSSLFAARHADLFSP